jgi:hypothetical protein
MKAHQSSRSTQAFSRRDLLAADAAIGRRQFHGEREETTVRIAQGLELQPGRVDLSPLYAGDFVAAELEHPEFTSRR